MKIEIIEINKKASEENKYPYLGQSKSNGKIVIFIEKEKGVSLTGGDGFFASNPGYFSEVWDEDNFKKFKGKITLSN
jgi:hypothetical protein